MAHCPAPFLKRRPTKPLTNEQLLALECRRYNKLSEKDRRSLTGRSIYRHMKELNELVLAA